MIKRRFLKLGLTALPVVGVAACTRWSRADETKALSHFEIQRTDSEWRELLTPAQFDVLRKEATERPFTSALNAQKARGRYLCAGCQLPLFSSEAKYDSGTGWPSFYDALPEAVGFRTDFKLLLPRTEYHCARCGGHQGHVFEDGPDPTGKRYCNNGVALSFEAI